MGTPKAYTVDEGTTLRQWVEEQGQYDGFEISYYPTFGYDTIVSSDGFWICGSVYPQNADDIIESGIYVLADV